MSPLVLKSLIGGKVEMLMPEDFELMSETMLNQKYPSSNRPTIVYTNPEGSVNMVVNHTWNKISLNQLPEAIPTFSNQFEKLYPNIKWYRKELVKLNERDFVVLEFISPALDTDIYNLMFVTELEGRLLMFSFNCTKDQEIAWKMTANKMMRSVRIED
ncbi:hypothetical protein JMN32_03595 [Fulvivirga sp. 29W222]|uniref:DUF1795 domain-containing protein n=1 Tax=Fulvivirga marina TaxID=2494733 RepID=A0A937FTA2_9BACT|nr:hypothetical protein [Fulvivirga marina]MBL6445375.1 hypothetical protein [Fulvivirga marina]